VLQDTRLEIGGNTRGHLHVAVQVDWLVRPSARRANLPPTLDVLAKTPLSGGRINRVELREGKMLDRVVLVHIHELDRREPLGVKCRPGRRDFQRRVLVGLGLELGHLRWKQVAGHDPHPGLVLHHDCGRRPRGGDGRVHLDQGIIFFEHPRPDSHQGFDLVIDAPAPDNAQIPLQGGPGQEIRQGGIHR